MSASGPSGPLVSVSHGHFIQRDSKNSEPAFAINEGSDESAHI